MKSKTTVITVDNLSKRYRIGLKDDLKDNFSDAFFDFLKSPLKNYKKHRSLYKFNKHDLREAASGTYSEQEDIIWALKDVSFSVEKGSVLAIIGKNGAGKSTLLKVLSRITEPTSGRVEIHGKCSSLLEVGTGFHPELTGRENVYLNGTILGMKKKEVDKKFDEIVSFSGVEKFIDTPVKRYSSGMVVRLAFSVAAHLEPDILIIDEVLAVGDAEFQKKCLTQMEKVGKDGRTVLFVSHNMPAVSSLCTSAMLLENGSVSAIGETDQILRQYMNSISSLSTGPIENRIGREGTGKARFSDFWIENDDGQRINDVMCTDKIVFKLSYTANDHLNSLRFIISVYDMYEQRLLRFDSGLSPGRVANWPKTGTIACSLDSPISLCPGRYTVNISIFADGAMADYIPYASQFHAVESDFFGTGKMHKSWPMFLLPNNWELE